MNQTENFTTKTSALEIQVEAAIQTAIAEIPNKHIFPVTAELLVDLLDQIDSIVSFPVSLEEHVIERIREILSIKPRVAGAPNIGY